jgi:hypothetical protein
VILVLALALCASTVGLAADFICEDSACLIGAINAANATLESDTITLQAFIINLTAVDNNSDGPNGLPSITSDITIKGSLTQIERRPIPPGSLPDFRIFHVAAIGKLTIDHVNILGGSLSSGKGAGILNAGGTVHIIGSLIAENTASALAVGGGVFNDTGGTLTITNSTVWQNSSGVAEGGAGGVVNKGVANVTGSDISENMGSGSGGGTGGIRNAGGTLHLSNSTIARNTANEQSGAGILNEGGGSVTITSSTIAENEAALPLSIGGGIWNAMGTVELRNSILVENKAQTASSPDTISNCAGAITSLGNNVIGVSTAADACVINAIGSDVRDIDAGVLDQYHRFEFFTETPDTGHFPLLPGSPAIDAGNTASPGSGGNACEATDQLGLSRPADGNLDGTAVCDIGSMEFFPITGFSPTSGPVGETVIITGGGFKFGTCCVTFGAVDAAFEVDSETQITATVPEGATTGPIAVTTPSGTVVSASAFTVTATVPAPPSITGFSPAEGPAGTSVIITGTNLGGAISVAFGATLASFRIDSTTRITATVPAGATTGPITVTTPGGTATSTSAYVVPKVNVVNGLVALAPLVVSRSESPVPGGPAGTMTIRATFTNTSSTGIKAPFFVVTALSGGNLLLNADGAPGGRGARLTPEVGVDGILAPGEAFTANFVVGLQQRSGFTFFVDLWGEPNP